MRRGMIVTLVLCGLLFTGTARASLEQMLGLWKNVDGDTRGITRLRIFTDRGGLQVQAWGKAHPNDTVMGPVPAQAYASSAGANLEQDAEAIFARMDNDFSVRRFVIHPDKFGRIAVGEMVLFTDRSGRTPYHNHYVFQRQAVITQPMPHPMPRPMPRPTLRPRPGRIPARVRPGLLRPGLQPLVTEDLIRFDWRKAKVKEIGGTRPGRPCGSSGTIASTARASSAGRIRPWSTTSPRAERPRVPIGARMPSPSIPIASPSRR